MLILDISGSFMCNAVAVVFVQYCILKTIYNIYFHPLKNYPGPRILAASRLPITYGNITGQSTHWALRLHEKYGPVVRMAPNELSYSDSTSWRDIYASNPARPTGMPRDRAFWEAMDDENAVPSLLNASEADHVRIRRAYAKAFSKGAIVEQEPLIATYVTHLLRHLYKRQHQPNDMVDMVTATLIDIMADLQFGEGLHLLDDNTYHHLIKSQIGLIKGSTILASLVEFPVIKIIFQLTLPHLIKRARAKYFGWMSEKLDHRLSAKSSRPDIVNFVMKQSKISEAEVRANLPIISIAQSDPSTVAISELMLHLSKTPTTLAQLQAEVRLTFQNMADINLATMEKMKLLNACVKEGLRIYPAVAGPFPRVVPEGGAMISGQWVPGGTRVYISLLAAFRSSANFYKPDTFLPERWYTDVSDEFSMDDKEVWKPFSVGTRDCVGKLMGNYLISLILCGIVLHFDFEVCGESKTWLSNGRSWSIWDKPPLMVKLTAVKSPA